MHTLSFRKLSLVCALVFVSACGDDGKGADESTGTSNATPAMTDPGTETTADPTGNPTGNPTGDPSGPDTDPTTTMPTTTMDTDPSGDPTGPAGGNFCQEACSADADCTAMGVDIGFTCKDNRCQGSSSGGCASDTDCQVTFSGWVTTCASQAECMATAQVCIDIGGGAGRCATPPSEFIMCTTLLQEEVMLPSIEGDMQLTVCANTDFECKDEVCQNPCEANADCAMLPGTPQCNVGTGRCECTSDDDCKNSGVMGYAVCNEGVCGCGSDADCMGAPNADTCTSDGFCGCSSESVCTMQTFDGTTPVCEGF